VEEASDRARATEVSEAGSVPFLRVANGADRPLLLLDGEELIGAKQNRILNTTVLVAAHAEVTIPVSCVEQGRWGYRGRQFRPGDASLYASLRARKAAWVSQSIRAGREHIADQGGVWAHLACRASELEVDSPTGAMRDLYARHEADMEAARRAWSPSRVRWGLSYVWPVGGWDSNCWRAKVSRQGAAVIFRQRAFDIGWKRRLGLRGGRVHRFVPSQFSIRGS